jgi:hypothetical protein
MLIPVLRSWMALHIHTGPITRVEGNLFKMEDMVSRIQMTPHILNPTVVRLLARRRRILISTCEETVFELTFFTPVLECYSVFNHGPPAVW